MRASEATIWDRSLARSYVSLHLTISPENLMDLSESNRVQFVVVIPRYEGDDDDLSLTWDTILARNWYGCLQTL